MLKYAIKAPDPEVRKVVLQSQFPWADGHTARMLEDAVEVDEASQMITPSHSWWWPSPDDGESLGIYQEYMIA
jgi:hypothetical protein